MAISGAKSVYFSDKVRTEQELFEDIIIESISIYGQNLFYVPRTIVDRDWVLNEDKESKFEDALELPMYIENVEGFGGEGDLFQKFGLEIRDETTFIAAKRTWERYVGEQTGLGRPNEGDLIYLPLSNAMFEISHIEHEEPFYQLSNLPVYKLTCRLFEYSGEDFDTGDSDIDAFENVATYQYLLQLNNGIFDVGDTITQTLPSGITMSAEVLSYGDAINEVYIGDIISDDGNYHEFVAGEIVLADDGDTAAVQAVTRIDGFDNDAFAKNTEIETEANGYIDWSESNPFGE